MRTYLGLFNLVTIILFNCDSNIKNHDLLNSFERKTLLNGKIVINSSELFNPQKLFLYDSILIVQDFGGTHCLNIYDLSGSHLYNYIRRGKGANELIMPFDITLVESHKQLTIYDVMLKKLFVYDLDSIIMKAQSLPSKIIAFSSKFFRVIKFNEQYLGIGPLEGGRYFLEDGNENLLGGFLNYPENDLHKNEPDHIKAMAYQGFIRKRPLKNEFVFAATNSGVIEICKLKNDRIEKKVNIYSHLPDYVPYNEGSGYGAQYTNNNKFGFRDVYVTLDYIYLLYSGRYPIKGTKKQDFLYGNDILLYNWKGEPIQSYRFEEDIMAFTVDEKKQFIYILAIKPEPVIKRYELK